MISIHLFATREDLLELLECVESEAPLKYSRMGYFTEAEFREGLDSYEEGALIPGLGVATAGSGVGCPRFLVSNRGTPVGVRSINTYNGVHCCVDERGKSDLPGVGSRGDLGGERAAEREPRFGVVLSGRQQVASEVQEMCESLV